MCCVKGAIYVNCFSCIKTSLNRGPFPMIILLRVHCLWLFKQLLIFLRLRKACDDVGGTVPNASWDCIIPLTSFLQFTLKVPPVRFHGIPLPWPFYVELILRFLTESATQRHKGGGGINTWTEVTYRRMYDFFKTVFLFIDEIPID